MLDPVQPLEYETGLLILVNIRTKQMLQWSTQPPINYPTG